MFQTVLAEGDPWPGGLLETVGTRNAIEQFDRLVDARWGRRIVEYDRRGAPRVPYGVAGYFGVAGNEVFIVPKFLGVEAEDAWTRALPLFLARCRDLPAEAVWVTSPGAFERCSGLMAWWADYYSVMLSKALRTPFLSYSPKTELLPYVRGRINWSRQIPEIASGGTRVWCTYRAYSAQSELNRLLRWAAARFAALSGSSATNARLRRCLEMLPDISDDPPPRPAVARLRVSPAHAAYRQPLDVARALYLANFPSLSPGGVAAVGAFIDMTRAWESFVNGLVRAASSEKVAGCGRLVCRYQDQAQFAAECPPGATHYFTRPDNTVTRADNHSVGVVVDAKYKGIAADPTKYRRIVSSDLYQIVCSCLARDWRSGLVLSPAIDPVAGVSMREWTVAADGVLLNIAHAKIPISAEHDASVLATLGGWLADNLPKYQSTASLAAPA